MATPEDGTASEVDPQVVADLLSEHPVRLAVLFGSQATGTVTAESDVDVAVEFDKSLSVEERHRARLDLIVDLMTALGMNDVDVTDLGTVRPAVGASALRTGTVLRGSEDRAAELLARFEAETSERSHEDRLREFDEILERLEAAV